MRRIGEHEGVPAIVLRARDGMAVPEAIQFRIDVENRPLMFQEGFDDETARYFNGYRDAVHLSLGQLLHPANELNDAFAAGLHDGFPP